MAHEAATYEATFPIPGDEGDLDVIVHKGARQSNAVALTFTIAA